MGRWDSWTRLDNDVQPGKGNQEPASKRLHATNRTQPADGSQMSRETSFRLSLAEVLDRAMDLADARSDHVSRVKDEIAHGRYNVASSELAERLLNIAQREFR